MFKGEMECLEKINLTNKREKYSIIIKCVRNEKQDSIFFM